ncbi:hypothetical protein JXI42_07640 [bacterium]|nr:hypothetical protein [bacterium]
MYKTDLAKKILTNLLIILLYILVNCPLLYSAVIIARDVHSAGSGLNNQRTIVRDSAGNLYVAYPGNDGSHWQIYIAFSSDGGYTWDPRWATITSNSLEDLQVSMAIDSHDTLHLVWKGNYSSSDADLMYRKYPGGTNTAICTRTGYPGTNCPSIAVGENDDLHVVFTGCPTSWYIRYLHFDRSTGTWDPREDVGSHTPSRWPSVEIDSDDDVHVVYRNQPGTYYRAAHKEKQDGSWLGVEQIDIALNSVEHTSIFIDKSDNIHATWVYKNGFYGNPDTVRYRRFNYATSTWEGVYSIFGTDTSVQFDGDVVVDTSGVTYVFYHDFESCYVSVSYDGGATFPVDSAVTELYGCRYPNARGSNYPEFNRIFDECIDFVYTWKHPDSTVNYLMYDNLCMTAPEVETTYVCAHFIEPEESTYSSCSDQNIRLWVGCCGDSDSMRFLSDTSTVEYFDSTSMTWERAYAPNPSIWLTLTRIPDATWIWTPEYPAPSSHGDWFRTIINSGCTEIDSAYIGIQCDNQATIYANGTYVDTTHGNSGGGMAGWRTRYEFNLTPYMHGGVDTLTFIGYNAGGQAGMLFEVIVICASACCGTIDSTMFELTVNEEIYDIFDPQLHFDGDSLLTFIPSAPDTFNNGDTVTACLTEAGDTCGGIMDSAICRTFFIDLQPPIISSVFPIPGDTLDTLLPYINFCLFDSITGVDTSSIIFSVDTLFYSPSLVWADSCWLVEWSASAPFDWGDDILVCLTVTDTTDYCADNFLDTCWDYHISSCADAVTWIICPEASGPILTSCWDQVVSFGIWDSTGADIDLDRIFFTMIIKYLRGGADTLTPSADFLMTGDTVIVNLNGTYGSGDSITVTLDSLFTTDGCRTVP